MENFSDRRLWQEITDALNKDEFEGLAELLAGTDTENLRFDQSNLLSAAYQICLACIQSNKDIAWHHQALQKADERERELRQGLGIIISAITNDDGVQGPTIKQEFLRELHVHPSQKQSAAKPRESQGIWRRIRTVFRFRSEQAPSAGYAHPLPPPEEVIHLPTDPTKEERLDSAMAEPKPVTIDKVHVNQENTPLLVVYFLGPFRVYQDEHSIEDWPSSKSKAIFKYLVAHRERPVAKDVLMDLFWPEADLDSARNNLNVAIYGLRQVLRNHRFEFSHVLFQNDSYQFNPKLRFWIDYENFMAHILYAQSLERKGEAAKAMDQLASAEALYDGEFLEEDRYENWLISQRQRLQDEYLNLLDRLTLYHYEQNDMTNCANVCLKTLAVDPCREEAHRRLMQCYHHQGQSYLALRQYHICSEALKNELDVVPSKATRELYELIRRQNRG